MSKDSNIQLVVPDTGTTCDETDTLRKFMDPAGGVYASTSPGTAISKFLKDKRHELRLSEVSLAKEQVKGGAGLEVSRSKQQLHDLPVLGAELRIVTDRKRKAVVAAYNTLDYATEGAPEPADAQPFADLEPAASALLAGAHTQLEISRNELVYLRYTEHPPVVDFGPGGPDPAIFEAGLPPDGELHLVYDVTIEAAEPRWRYQVVLDAVSRELLFVKSLTKSATATLYAYYPDPVTSADNGTLGPTSTNADLNPELEQVTAEIDAADGGVYHLRGEHFAAVDEEAPVFAPPTENSASFMYDATDREFLSANAYYWLDTYAQHLLSLGVTELNNGFPGLIEFDAQSLNGLDNSHYHGGTSPHICFGEGGVPDAADMAVITHELTHGICDYVDSNQGGNAGYEHSWCDAMPVIFRDRFNALRVRRRETFPFDNVGDMWSSVRSLDRTERFDDAGFSGYGSPLRQSMLGTAFFDCYEGIGGHSDHSGVRSAAADTMLRTLLEALVVLPDNSSTSVSAARTIAEATITADEALTGGLHSKVFYDAYVERGLFEPRAVDVYIRDSGADTGEHPSPSPHWHSPDIWVRNNPPPADPNNPNDPNAGEDPLAGHQTPIVGVPNYMYVRVHNKGAQAASNFSVDAYHCNPGTGMAWPGHFELMGTLAVTEDIPHNGSVVVGPFIWTPEVEEHECLLAVARGNDDPTIADTLMGSVPHWQLVRFDNNVGQRNVKPELSLPGGKTKMTFLMHGDNDAASSNDLSIDARALPADTHIEVKILRRITDDAQLQGLTILSQSSLWMTLEMAGGVEGVLSGFTLRRNDQVGVTLTVDFSYTAQDGMVYPIIATQVLDGMVAGRMTIEITAVKESEDYVYGNPRSRELHVISCPFWDKISQKNKIPYQTVVDGLARGYNGCAFCMPEHDTG